MIMLTKMNIDWLPCSTIRSFIAESPCLPSLFCSHPETVSLAGTAHCLQAVGLLAFPIIRTLQRLPLLRSDLFRARRSGQARHRHRQLGAGCCVLPAGGAEAPSIEANKKLRMLLLLYIVSVAWPFWYIKINAFPRFYRH